MPRGAGQVARGSACCARRADQLREEGKFAAGKPVLRRRAQPVVQEAPDDHNTRVVGQLGSEAQETNDRERLVRRRRRQHVTYV